MMDPRSLQEIDLPGDFAPRVIAIARREQHRRRVRFRLAAAAGATLLVALIPLSRLRNHRTDLRDSATMTWQEDAVEAAQLADATSPDEVTDYLVPNTTRVGEFAAAYTDAAWQYDSDWASGN